MLARNKIALTALLPLLLSGCQQNLFQKPTVTPKSLRDLPAVRLSYAFEADTIPPPQAGQTAPDDEKLAVIQADFDQNRAGENLERTIISPDKQRVAAVYKKTGDGESDFRLDIYSTEGQLVKQASPPQMALRFPDVITWSPDSLSLAFVAATRAGSQSGPTQTAPTPPDLEVPPAAANTADVNAAANALASGVNSNANAPANTAPTPAAPSAVRLFFTEQVYICNRDGVDLKHVSQKDTLVYFHLAWSPDSNALATLSCTFREWEYTAAIAKMRQEALLPMGRPRLIEKVGRERLLDDNITTVFPVWSPDSTKVAYAFDKEVKVYDAVGESPTTASIPLRVPLLTASQKFEQAAQASEQGANSNAAANTAGNAAPSTPQAVEVMPDESKLSSFNPIVELKWADEKTIYLQTGFIKEMLDEKLNARSFLRWHKLTLSAQAIPLGS